MQRSHGAAETAFAARASTLALILIVALAPLRPQGARAADDPDFAAVDAYVAREVRDTGIPGAALAVVRGGAVAHLQGFGRADGAGRPVTPQTPFVLGSLSKSFTALAVMQLVEAGQVELDAPVRRYLPWFRLADDAAAGRITVRHLLNQTSGIPRAAGLVPLQGPPATTLEAQVRALATVAPAGAPGARYAYSNANYEVLGLLVEAVSGEPYGEYVRGHIFAPLGMRHSHSALEPALLDGLAGANRFFFGAVLGERPNYRADFLPAGFLIASAEDLGHYLAAQLDDGRYDGAAILSPAGIAAMHQPGVRQGGVARDAGYGMGWATATVSGIATVQHNGSTGDMHAIALLAPGAGWGVALLYNGTSTLYELSQKLDTIALGVLSQLVGRAPPGTLRGLYWAFDALAILVTALQLRALSRLVRGRATGSRWPVLARLHRSRAGRLWAWYSQLALPILLLIGFPRLLESPWRILARTDLGLWLLALAGLQLARGLIRLARHPALRRPWPRRPAPAPHTASSAG